MRAAPSPEAFIQGLRGLMHLDSHTYRREDLERWHSSLATLLLELRRNLNSLAPIHKLPPELFQRIFQEVVLLAGDGIPVLRERHSNLVPTSALLTLTHVCHTWRQIAIARKSLWRRVDNRKTLQLHTFVYRSHPLPILSLHLSVIQTVDSIRWMDHVLSHYGSRVRRLDLAEYPPFAAMVIYPLDRLTLNPDTLECLTVCSETSLCYPPSFPAEPQPPPNPEYGQMFRNLKAFAISPVIMHLPPNPFPRLTHLYLAFPRGLPTEVGCAVACLRSLLLRTPALKFLHLSGLSRDTDQDPEHQLMPAVGLPCLRVFVCTRSEVSAALELLELFKLPRDALVRLDGLYCEDPDEEPLPRCIASPELFASFTRLKLWTTHEDLQLVAEGPNAKGENEGEPTSGLWIRATCVGLGADSWSDWLGDLLQAAISLDAIQALDACVLDEHLLHSIVPKMRNLRDLYLLINPSYTHIGDGDHCEAVAVRLYRRLCGIHDESDSQAYPSELCCPALRRLALEIHSSYGKKYCMGNIKDFLKDRADRLQCPLESFYVLPRLPIVEHEEGNERERKEEEEKEGPSAIPEEVLQDTIKLELAPYLDVVSEINVMGALDPLPFSTFAMWDVWKAEAAEEYWTLSDEEKARHYIPWTPGRVEQGASLVKDGNV
ncbi:hypothetical protein BC628DRAFT_1422781 [Trametes gibbosa]|nr:hypothetical protein BC628DRAFT_1422781 [Trametes gibbosa]